MVFILPQEVLFCFCPFLLGLFNIAAFPLIKYQSVLLQLFVAAVLVLYIPKKVSKQISLKAPATAQYASLDEITCTKEEDFYIVTGYVDAQNSHGAMIRTPFKIKAKKENGEWKTITNPFMVASGRLGSRLAIYSDNTYRNASKFIPACVLNHLL